MNEQWKEIPQTNGMYAVSDGGRVASKYTHGRTKEDAESSINAGVPCGYILLNPWKDKYGYLVVQIRENGVRRFRFVHRLVMSAFVGESDLQVNHINEIKHDNRLVNLEYVTAKENSRYSKERPVERYDLETGKVRAVYASITAAGEDGYNVGNVHSVCNGKLKTCGGYGWRYHNGK